MKKPYIILLTLALLAFAAISRGQDATTDTNAPTASQGAFTKTNLTPVIGALADWFKAVKPYLTNDDVILHIHGDYSMHSHKMGFGGAVALPINNILYAGFGYTHVNGNDYYGPFTASIGREFNVPIIGKTYLLATTGPDLQFGHGATISAESSAGFEKAWKINEKWYAGISGASVNITGEPGVIVRGGGFISYKW